MVSGWIVLYGFTSVCFVWVARYCKHPKDKGLKLGAGIIAFYMLFNWPMFVLDWLMWSAVNCKVPIQCMPLVSVADLPASTTHAINHPLPGPQVAFTTGMNLNVVQLTGAGQGPKTSPE